MFILMALFFIHSTIDNRNVTREFTKEISFNPSKQDYPEAMLILMGLIIIFLFQFMGICKKKL